MKAIEINVVSGARVVLDSGETFEMWYYNTITGNVHGFTIPNGSSEGKKKEVTLLDVIRKEIIPFDKSVYFVRSYGKRGGHFGKGDGVNEAIKACRKAGAKASDIAQIDRVEYYADQEDPCVTTDGSISRKGHIERINGRVMTVKSWTGYLE